MVNLKFVGVLCLVAVVSKLCGGVKRCNTTDLTTPQCAETEICDQSLSTCQCLPGYSRQNATFCVLDTPSSPSPLRPNYSNLVDNKGNGSLLAGILVPVFLILFVISSIYISRKYELIKWLRNKLHHRPQNYDEFMIGQEDDEDDPPLQ